MRGFRARYAGVCAKCSQSFDAGDRITWARKGTKRYYHVNCMGNDAEEAPETETQAPAATGAAEDALEVLAAALSDRMSAAIDADEVRRIAKDVVHEEASAFIREEVQKVAAPLVVHVKHEDGRTVKVEGVQHRLFPRLLYLIQKRHNAYLFGPSQSGKSTAAHNAARALGLPFYYVSLNPQTPDSRLVGFIRPDGNYQETVFHKAYAEGGVICLDEVDNASASLLTTLNSALTNGAASFPSGMVPRHKDCVIIATGNTPGRGGTSQYPERRPLDGAFMERFTFLHWDYDETLESALVKGINADKAPTILAWVRQVRKYALENGLRLMATPTSAMKLAEYLNDTEFAKVEDIADAVVFKGIDAATRTQVLEACPLPRLR